MVSTSMHISLLMNQEAVHFSGYKNGFWSQVAQTVLHTLLHPGTSWCERLYYTVGLLGGLNIKHAE